MGEIIKFLETKQDIKTRKDIIEFVVTHVGADREIMRMLKMATADDAEALLKDINVNLQAHQLKLKHIQELYSDFAASSIYTRTDLALGLLSFVVDALELEPMQNDYLASIFYKILNGKRASIILETIEGVCK